MVTAAPVVPQDPQPGLTDTPFTRSGLETTGYPGLARRQYRKSELRQCPAGGRAPLSLLLRFKFFRAAATSIWKFNI
jgi:hypothetical protein